MGKKNLKTRTQFTSTLRNDLYLRLQQASLHSDIPISRILDRAIEKHLQDLEPTLNIDTTYKKDE